MGTVKNGILVSVQLVLAVALVLGFFSWAPWINCRPINELPEIGSQGLEVPTEARCFNVNHGEVVFSKRLPRTEDPIGFYTLAALLIACFAALFGVNKFHRRARREDGG
jgi:hypothetical protein